MTPRNPTGYRLFVSRSRNGGEQLIVEDATRRAVAYLETEPHTLKRYTGRRAVETRELLLAISARATDGAWVTISAWIGPDGAQKPWHYASRMPPDKPRRERRVALAVDDIGPAIDRMLELQAQHLPQLPPRRYYDLASFP